MISIVKVDCIAIPAIKILAHTTWAIAYKEILSQHQMDYMLELMYSEAALNQQMIQGHQQFILASNEKQPAGFASYSPKNTATPYIFHLHKIYIHPNQQGNGVGKLLLNYVLQDIKCTGATNLQLNVNRNNPALNFYLKFGFTIIREEDIDIGNGYFMNDYVMDFELEK